MSKLSNYRIYIEGDDNGIDATRNCIITDTLTAQEARNRRLRLLSGIETINHIDVYDLSDAAAPVKLAVLKPVDFQPLSGTWGVEVVEGVTLKRPHEATNRAATFHYPADKPKKSGGTPVSIDLRVDVEQAANEIVRAYRGLDVEKADDSAPRETKKQLVEKVKKQTESDAKTRVSLVELATLYKLSFDDSTTNESLSGMITAHVLKTVKK